MFCSAFMFCAAYSTKHQPIKVNGGLQKCLTFLSYFCSFSFKKLIFKKLNNGFGPLLPVDPNRLFSF